MQTQYANGIVKTTTDCCAMCQLSRIDNYTRIIDIEAVLKQLKKEKDNNIEVGITTGNGQTSVFSIISPGENILEKNLIKLGFKDSYSFERRKGYPKKGDLKMYIKKL